MSAYSQKCWILALALLMLSGTVWAQCDGPTSDFVIDATSILTITSCQTLVYERVTLDPSIAHGDVIPLPLLLNITGHFEIAAVWQIVIFVPFLCKRSVLTFLRW